MQRSRGKTNAVPFQTRGRSAGPCDVGKSGGFAKIKQLSVTRGSHSAWGRCQHQLHLSARRTYSRIHIREAERLPRLGGLVPMHRILHAQHEYAAHGTEVREDLAALPGECGSVECHAGVWIRTLAYDILSDPRNTRICSKGQCPTLSLDQTSFGRGAHLHRTV